MPEKIAPEERLLSLTVALMAHRYGLTKEQILSLGANPIFVENVDTDARCVRQGSSGSTVNTRQWTKAPVARIQRRNVDPVGEVGHD